jgi:hypothetical protein
MCVVPTTEAKSAMSCLTLLALVQKTVYSVASHTDLHSNITTSLSVKRQQKKCHSRIYIPFHPPMTTIFTRLVYRTV